MRYALCAMRYAICDMRYAICDMRYDKSILNPYQIHTKSIPNPYQIHTKSSYAICCDMMRYALCDMRYAICDMRYAICDMRYASRNTAVPFTSIARTVSSIAFLPIITLITRHDHLSPLVIQASRTSRVPRYIGIHHMFAVNSGNGNGAFSIGRILAERHAAFPFQVIKYVYVRVCARMCMLDMYIFRFRTGAMANRYSDERHLPEPDGDRRWHDCVICDLWFVIYDFVN
jgi:hypothetical protein